MSKSRPKEVQADYALGQEVEVGSNEKEQVKAVVTAIIVRDTGITYECAWMSSTSRCTGNFSKFEIKSRKSPSAQRIGFTNDDAE